MDTKISQFLSLEPDLTIDDIDLDGVLNDIPDFEETYTSKTDEIASPTSPLSNSNSINYHMNMDTNINNMLLLKSENFILTQKIETLRHMVTEYTTKAKEIELRLQHEYNLKEQQYINRIEQLQYQIKNQKTKLNVHKNLIYEQSNNEESNQFQSISETNKEYSQLNKKLSHQIMQQHQQLDALHNENILIKSINQQCEIRFKQQAARIEELQKKLEQKYASLPSIKYIRTESPQTVQLRDLQKSSTGAGTVSQNTVYSSADSIPKLFDHEYTHANTSFVPLGLPDSTENLFDAFNDANAEEKTIESSRILAIPLTNIHESKSMNILHKEHRTRKGTLVIKQLPYSTETHICVNVFVEFEGGNKEYLVMYFNKNYNVKELIQLLASSETMYHILKNKDIYVYAANDDGELDNKTKVLDHEQVIAEMGIINFYVKILNDGNAYKPLSTIHSLSKSEQLTNMNEVSNAPICDNNCIIV